MIKELSSKLLHELELGLDRVTTQVSNPLEKSLQSLKLIRDALKKLKQLILEYPIDDEQAEILLFKYIKPSFYCHQIYCTEMYTIETDLPFGDVSKQLLFLEEELSYVERFFKKYAFLYQYYKLDANDMDSLYFVRGKEAQTVLLPNVPELDPNFSTGCGYLFSKFKAFEMLKAWLQEKMACLKVNPNNPIIDFNGTVMPDLRWTGDAINLAELGYGIYYSSQLNNGTAGIAQIFRWLEEKLHIKIGIPAKRFAEIRARKRLSRTRFIDEMKDGILRKLEQEEAHNSHEVSNREREKD
jgi:hypothetical protein